jgi:cation transport ATPase
MLSWLCRAPLHHGWSLHIAAVLWNLGNAIAVGTFGFWLWPGDWAQALFNALAVLLVACHCGLGLGVPIALWHAMHRIARLGIVPAGSELVEGGPESARSSSTRRGHT